MEDCQIVLGAGHPPPAVEKFLKMGEEMAHLTAFLSLKSV